jgi:hypothetical protein
MGITVIIGYFASDYNITGYYRLPPLINLWSGNMVITGKHEHVHTMPSWADSTTARIRLTCISWRQPPSSFCIMRHVSFVVGFISSSC